jgi:hypothetical protein
MLYSLGASISAQCAVPRCKFAEQTQKPIQGFELFGSLGISGKRRNTGGGGDGCSTGLFAIMVV